MYNLEMWDTGERYLHKFDYILPACVKNCDVILFFFSITDRYDIISTTYLLECFVYTICSTIDHKTSFYIHFQVGISAYIHNVTIIIIHIHISFLYLLHISYPRVIV